MSRYSNHALKPRNGHTLVVLIVARISGCASQKEMSLEDQADHAKEEVAELYDGPVENLMCSASRRWRCWHSIGFDGPLAVRRIVAELTAVMYQLDGFDAQYADMVQTAVRDRSGGAAERWKTLEHHEAVLSRERDNLTAAILEYGTRPMFQKKLGKLDERERKLKRERYELESLRSRDLQLPASVTELRSSLENKFEKLAIESFDLGTLMQQLVPEFHVYSVRLCDGGHLLPRARVKLDLVGSVPDAEHVPSLKELLTRVITIDLFDRPPQRERIRADPARLATLSCIGTGCRGSSEIS